MKLIDSNVWLALALAAHEHHGQASAWVARQSPREVAFCGMTQMSFLRLLTTRAVLSPYGNPPLTNKEAWELYGEFIADARVAFAQEPSGLEEHWKRLASISSSSPKLWMDAYLAAFAIAGGHQLVTIDSAFNQFPGLDLVLLA